MVWDMHELSRWIQERMDGRGWKQADLVRASGLSKQLVSRLVTDARDRLDDMPDSQTIQGLARAFNVPEGAVLVIAARAYGVPVDEPTVIPTTDGISDTQLAAELFRRLQRKEDEHGRESAPMNVTPMSRRRTLPKPPQRRGKAARDNDE